MYIDRNELEEYPFKGRFYTAEDNMPADGDMLADEVEMSNVPEHTVMEVMCDIQASNKVFASSTSGSYLDIYFPFDKSAGIDVRVGQRFKSDDWYRPVDGRVIGLVPTQMGGCVANIKEIGIDGEEMEEWRG